MATREELELLASRHLDGEITAAEEAALQAALADPAFAEWFDELKRTHEAMAEFAAQNPAPADIAAGVNQAVGGKAHALPGVRWTTWVAAAAALVMALGLVIGANYMGGSQPPQDPPIAQAPPRQTEITVLSEGSVRVQDSDGTREGGNVSARVSLPATVRAPADTHAVLRVGESLAVLQPGATARLADVDADGVPQIESVEGDLYLESRTGALASRLGQWRVRMERAGLMLRRADGAVTAEPAFGNVRIGERRVEYRQIASLHAGAVQVAAAQNGALEDWAIEGRLDAIRQELRVLLGDSYDKLLPEFQKYWEPPLRGIMSRPADAAASAMLIRFFEEHLWLPEWGEVERRALRNLADIIGEGTSEDDVPKRMRQDIQRARDFARQNPDFARSLVRGALERRK